MATSAQAANGSTARERVSLSVLARTALRRFLTRAPSGVRISDADAGWVTASAGAATEEVLESSPQSEPGTWLVSWGEADACVIQDSVVFGRNPTTPAGYSDAVRRSFDPGERSVSKTHAALRVVGDALVVVDLNSTNGTRLIAADGEARALEPDVEAEVGTGHSIEMGSLLLRVAHVTGWRS